MSKILVTRAELRWSSEETQVLEDLFPKAPRTRIEEAIPNRTWYSMRNKASRLGIKREALGRSPDGTFKQIRKRFSLKNFDDGCIDNHGRFRVWLPEHPRAYNEGYIMRSIVAYETYHNVKVPPDMDIHHKDKDRLNDSKENLVMMIHGEHTALHSRVPEVTRICKHCRKEFMIKNWRLKDSTRGQFCSQKCYHIHKRSEKHKTAISEGLKRAYREERR